MCIFKMTICNNNKNISNRCIYLHKTLIVPIPIWFSLPRNYVALKKGWVGGNARR